MIAFLVAGTASGVGKTTVSLALMAALRQRGFAVQPFKCGPDFLDASHHSAICGRASRNLDGWMLDLHANRGIFDSACRDAQVAVVEGMMGLFDGVAGGGEEGSSGEMAKRLGLPVVLVLDASTSARSIAAVVKGFETFDPELRFAGVVLNGVAGESHYRMLEAAIVSSCKLPILGWLPRNSELAIPERHLGLHGAAEQENSPEKLEERLKAWAAFAEANLDLDSILRNRDCAYLPDQPVQPAVPAEAPLVVSGEKIRLGVARDQAFSFYYEDNFDLLREFGAELVEFSPLTGSFPENLDALYFGGGYPELHAQRLSENRTLLAAVRSFASAGRPIYAECGGMMYLAQTLTNVEGETFPMAAVLPLAVQMTRRLVHFGYAEAEFTLDCLLGRKGTRMRGHSFHCSQAALTGELDTAYRVRFSLSGREENEGYSRGCVLASYIHLHFRANPQAARAFLEHALHGRKASALRTQEFAG
ncbi:MAG TPA: cobyrinate a,c-diamide synthase [Acidobacteriaceae bacterium]|nr:cobyrinate a,c-diamide synthase [Acidobacteriaceae bacterium]